GEQHRHYGGEELCGAAQNKCPVRLVIGDEIDGAGQQAAGHQWRYVKLALANPAAKGLGTESCDHRDGERQTKVQRQKLLAGNLPPGPGSHVNITVEVISGCTDLDTVEHHEQEADA